MKWFALLVAILLLVAPISSPGQKKGKSVGKLQKKLEDIEKSKRETEKRLGATKKNIKGVRSEINLLETRMQKVSDELANVSDQLERETILQAKLKAELDKATEGVRAKRIQVSKRLRRIYMDGKPNILEFVFGSKSSADLATREFVATRVEKADRKLFDDYRAIRDIVAQKKKEQDDQVRRVSALQESHQSKQNELADAQKAKEGYLNTLQEKKGDLEGVLDDLDNDAAAIEGEIKAALARARAEARRREAEAKKKGETYTPPPKHTGGFVRPTGGAVTSSFGMRFHPILKYSRLHAGVDFGGGHGAPVYAAGAGTVISASTRSGYGNCLVIDHGNGISTVYGHLSRFSVSEGQTVTSHQRIGAIGSTGLATGPHLHFEVRVNGRAVNPMGYL